MTLVAVPSYTERKAAGDAHEDRVRIKLEECGWVVGRYGLGTLPAPVACLIGMSDTPHRYHPDMLAVRGRSICAVDGKARTQRNANSRQYWLTKRSLRGLRRFGADNDMFVHLVFDDFTVMTPEEVMRAAGINRLSDAGEVIHIPVGLGTPFELVFGQPWAWTEPLRLVA